MPNIQLSNNLRYLRKKYGLTQSQMGEILNISRQAYSNYETNSRTPDLDTLLFLADFYKVSLDDIVLTNLKDKMPYPGKNDRISEDPVPYIFTKNTKTGNTIYLKDEEMDLIARFRALSNENKQIITGFLRANS
ncbi:MAG: helix-turn-helix domain-containing protein [Dorea sp.]|jgi:transcriptional regulator with XRE-family HTH domain|nr:helix-turn-helix domain-containing protein [Dorea sp.]